jgi:phage terminase small subunit
MPARKPAALIVRHETAAEKRQRAERESALRPGQGLPMAAPARLAGHEQASAAWRRLMRMYGDVEGEIVTRLDMDLLVDYCMLLEQLAELDHMRKTTYQIWLDLGQAHDRAKKAAAKSEQELKGDQVSDEQVAAAEKLHDRAVMLALKCVDAFEAVVKLDGRVDRKRALLLQLRQALYLTPRSRAGTAPVKKEAEEPLDDLELLLNDVNNTLNNGRGDGR